ncbi:MAG: hypothetical protein J07HR59_01240 [Halorubrum sp. J07HR59]|nr:MAG: hypothetical protein J07HR59_01240 [Halorubrum sp. J07HR59]
MTQPRVPGDSESVELPCGQEIRRGELDLGMRQFECDCGDSHAVVMDMHPPGRFVPETLVTVLREAIETTSDEMPEFGTPHLMGMTLEEFPEAVVAIDAADDGSVGYALAWITDFDSCRLHEVVVELIVELMEHAVSHADDEDALRQFEDQMLEFDVPEFVEAYREERDLERRDSFA